MREGKLQPGFELRDHMRYLSRALPLQTRVHTCRLSSSVAYCRFVAQESLRISRFSWQFFEICTKGWQPTTFWEVAARYNLFEP
jgi:hypothetical protein